MKLSARVRAAIAAWAVILLTGEWLIMDYAVTLQCQTVVGGINNKRHHTPTYRMLIIADPQLTDAYSYKNTGVTLRVVEWFCDVYMRRSYTSIRRHYYPDLNGVLFLGDLFDGGREHLAAVDFEREVDRFNWIFVREQDRIQRFYMAGNHDIGVANAVLPAMSKRFQATFETVLNYELHVAGHRIVVLDTLSLSSSIPTIHTESQDFIMQQNPGNASVPVILITHIPLYRPDGDSCGNVGRSTSSSINQSFGNQYQNLVVAPLSAAILYHLQPSLILSGDDHDQCRHVHYWKDKQFLEYTLGTFSWMQGNWYPSFGILNLYVDDDSPSHTLTICFLPSQIRIYIVYGFLAIVTVTLLLLTSSKSFTASIGRRIKGGLNNYHSAVLEKMEMTSLVGIRQNNSWLMEGLRSCLVVAAAAVCIFLTIHAIDAKM